MSIGLSFQLLFLSFLAFISLSTSSAQDFDGKRSALIIIDMQEPFITRGGHAHKEENKEKVEKILSQQIAAIEQAKKADIPIVFIEYQRHGETNPRLTAAASGHSKVAHFIKNSDGMLADWNQSREEIIKYLDSNGIENLIISGANGGACVYSSIAGILATDRFNVIAFSEGIADFNYADFIYPYQGFYKDMKAQSCDFVEVNCLTDITNVLSCSGDIRTAINDSTQVEKQRSPLEYVPSLGTSPTGIGW